ncbi:MAG: exodeoxyribonuclease V subunit gamma, partial [Neisseriaceae bacterium]|nr:exodeoxyribonuclease V subunit gamma [Neisseriaceae bacterium]
MLYLYQSNRLETLAQMMMQVQQTSPLSSPMLPEQVVIQSQGMRRYIEQFLAKHQGIVANMQFSLPAGLAWQLMREHLPNLASMNPFASEVLRWRLLALFRSEHFAQSDDFQAARAYLMS